MGENGVCDRMLSELKSTGKSNVFHKCIPAKSAVLPEKQRSPPLARLPFSQSNNPKHRSIITSRTTKNTTTERHREMGAVIKLVDAILFFFFLLIAVVAPLFDAQSCLPRDLYPDYLVDLNTWYSREYGDYLISEKPNFFVGLVWLELLFLWPLSIANLYGIVAGKSWLRTTSLIYGVSISTSMVKAMIGSNIAL
ncbi:unnamed protein product [Ilex paraguariensis]|uniref:EXPERA domain-containing protein n=1 Tax=Ilex paraguariensis TaxID=185542 RepID=A0ABC8UVR8_9AQUA